MIDCYSDGYGNLLNQKHWWPFDFTNSSSYETWKYRMAAKSFLENRELTVVQAWIWCAHMANANGIHDSVAHTATYTTRSREPFLLLHNRPPQEDIALDIVNTVDPDKVLWLGQQPPFAVSLLILCNCNWESQCNCINNFGRLGLTKIVTYFTAALTPNCFLYDWFMIWCKACSDGRETSLFNRTVLFLLWMNSDLE